MPVGSRCADRRLTSMGEHEWVVLRPGAPDERAVPIPGRLLVGREGAGVEPARRLLIDSTAVSRDHLEIRSHPTGGTRLLDLSTNGTRVNGRRVQRGEPVSIHDGDRIEIGGIELLFRSLVAPPVPAEVMETMRTTGLARVAVVVGDIVGYTAMTEEHGGRAVAREVESLFGSLSLLLAEHQGRVSNFVGDAIFAAWDADRDPRAAESAIAFALSAAELVAGRAGTAAATIGELQMGWAVTLGEAVKGRPVPSHEAIHGDVVNLAFRLSGAAARDGLATVLVSADAAAAAPDAARYGPATELTVRGRRAPAVVHAAGRPG